MPRSRGGPFNIGLDIDPIDWIIDVSMPRSRGGPFNGPIVTCQAGSNLQFQCRDLAAVPSTFIIATCISLPRAFQCRDLAAVPSTHNTKSVAVSIVDVSMPRSRGGP